MVAWFRKRTQPRILFLENRQVVEAAFHSRPRDLYNRTLQIPGLEAGEGGGAPRAGSRAFDIALIGCFGHPVARAVPPEAPFDEARLRGIRKRVVVIHDAQKRAFRGGHRAMRSFLNDWATHVILTYRCDTSERLLRKCRGVRRIYWLPHHIDTSVYRDYGLQKQTDVLVYGKVKPEDYPLRLRLAELLPRTKLRVEVIEHPGERGKGQGVTGEALARRIQQAWMTVATPSRYDYLLAKFLEIAACGSVVAGRLASEAESIWGGNYIRLDEGMSDEEIIRRLEAALADSRRLKAMADAIAGPIRRDFGYERYAPRLRDILNDIHRRP